MAMISMRISVLYLKMDSKLIAILFTNLLITNLLRKVFYQESSSRREDI